MKVKDINECDFINYKKPSMFIAFNTCTFKCDRFNKCHVCQNSNLANEPDIEISVDEICARYMANPITEAFVFGGLEPFDTNLYLLELVKCIREKYNINDDIVIYTGYTPNELIQGWRDCKGYDMVSLKVYEALKRYPNIIIKYGRFIMNQESHFDKILGVKLASMNQFAEELK